MGPHMKTSKHNLNHDPEQPLFFVRPLKERRNTWLKVIKTEFYWLRKQSDTAKIFTLIAINVIGLIILFIWCQLTSSLALLAYTYLSWLNLFCLISWLVSCWCSAQQASWTFTYGFGRCEILLVFASFTVPIIASFFIFKECIEKLVEPTIVHVDHLSCIALVGCLLNSVLTSFIRHSTLTHIIRNASPSIIQQHLIDILQGSSVPRVRWPGAGRLVPSRLNPLVVLSMAGFVCLVAEHVIIRVYGYLRCDAIVAFVIALLTICTLLPVCSFAANILLQTLPPSVASLVDRRLREALTIDGVLEFSDERFWLVGVAPAADWSETGGWLVAGTLHVRVKRDAHEREVLAKVRHKLGPTVQLLTIQVLKDDWSLASSHWPSCKEESNIESPSVEETKALYSYQDTSTFVQSNNSTNAHNYSINSNYFTSQNSSNFKSDGMNFDNADFSTVYNSDSIENSGATKDLINIT